MSDDQPETVPHPVAPVLRREALLPNERSRGLGTVAVVCTMAGVASGLALATTLMAMQVADSMSTRVCPYQHSEITPVEVGQDRGFLGIRYSFRHGVINVDKVFAGTPAEAIALQPGDHLISFNGNRVDSMAELQDQVFQARPGSTPSLLIERDGAALTLRPTLIAYPILR